MNIQIQILCELREQVYKSRYLFKSIVLPVIMRDKFAYRIKATSLLKLKNLPLQIP